MGKEQRILGIGNGSFSAADPEQCSRNPGVLEGLNSLERSAISAERKGNRRFQENGAWRSHDRCSRCGADAEVLAPQETKHITQSAGAG